MEILWSSLYLPTTDAKAVSAALTEIHSAAGFLPYNPFPGGTGTPGSAEQLVRLFVAPAESGWTRLIGFPQRDLLPKLAQKLGLGMLYVWIGQEEGEVEAINGKLAQFLAEGKTEADLQNARQATLFAAPPSPTIVSSLAQEYGIDPQQAGGLIEKTTQSLFGKMNSADKMQGAAALANKAVFSWESPAAQRVGAIMQALHVADNWRDPSFRELAAAYQIACLLELDENAALLPGDEAILDKVEYPLDYSLAYFAR